MRPIAMMQAQFKADTKEGESLHFENCRGGYFSNTDEYGLKVVGKTFQNGTPTPDAPIDIQCVKKGTKIICGNEIIVPCDLYEGDVWYPMSGKVKKQTQISTIREVTTYIPRRYKEYIWFQDVDAKTVANSKIWCATHKGKLTWWFEGYAIQPHLTNLTSSTVYFSLKYTDLGKEYNKNTEDAVIINAANRYLTERGGISYICTRRETLIKQYDPQPIFAPMGTVNVLQQSTDLSADLSATVLVRR